MVESARSRHVIFGTLPCFKIASLNQDARVATNVGSDTLRRRSSQAKSRKQVGRKDQLPFQDSYSKMSIQKDRRKIGKERVHREASFKSVNLVSVFLARPGLRRGHKMKPCNKKEAPAKSRGTWRKMSTNSKIIDEATYCSLIEIKAMPAPVSKSPEEREFVVDSRASMHMMSKRDLSPAELDTL